MPKQQEPTIEEKSAESYFPVEEDFKTTTEKKIREETPREEIIKRITTKKVKTAPEVETITKVGKKKSTRKKKYSKRKTVKRPRAKKTTIKKVKYAPEKITLTNKGYELIITEKPQAAAKIAAALGKVTKNTYQKVHYYEIDRKGKKLVVACAVGHLMTLKQNTRGEIPAFDISWTPNYMVRKRDFTKRYYETIKKLAKKASSLTVATDYDVEGEVIGMNVVRFICGQKDASRMKFSTLTPKELEKAYENKTKTLNWNQGIAGETRHYLDWFYGINLSRALMNAIKSTGTFKIMSIGRVQGPTLKLIVDKEREIQKFEPEPYWQEFITIDDGKNQLELKYTKDIFDKKELKNFNKLKDQKATTSTTKSQQSIPPNPPFNLTTLQTEAYKLYGITPSRTLQIAQGLYLNGLISYPRTSSQKLPEVIGYKDILKKVAKKFKAEKLITKTTPIEGKKTDTAHPSIYPTGTFQPLSNDDETLYDLIAKRFIALFCDNALIDRKNVKAIPTENTNLTFSTNGKQIKEKGWMAIYPIKGKDIEIPDFEGPTDIIDQRKEDKETQPPRRFSPASILSDLEKRNLGTKATRANILETLYDRNYIQDTSIRATPLGISLIETLENHSPIIIDEQLTREFEEDMTAIEESKKSDLQSEENKILDKAKITITKITKDFERDKAIIGKELVDATTAFRKQQKEENKLTLCPECKKGHLAITYSPRNKRFFVACDAYPKCRTTFSLPPDGTIKKVDKICEECGFPLLIRLKGGKKPWIFCFNKECPSNQKRIEEYRKKQEQKAEDSKID